MIGREDKVAEVEVVRVLHDAFFVGAAVPTVRCDDRVSAKSAAEGDQLFIVLFELFVTSAIVAVSAASMADASALTASSTVAFKAATEASAVLKPSPSFVVVAVVVVVDIWFDGFDCFPTLLWTST